MTRAAIAGTGFYVPERIVTNQDMTRWMDTSDEWIFQRSGIQQRRWVERGPDGHTVETGSEMGAKAASRALAQGGVAPEDVDLVIYATLNPDYFFPGNGVFIEDLLGLKTAGAMDIRNQCSGFVYGLAAADGFIQSGTIRTALVIGGEIQSTALDLTTRGREMAVLFGDGAGAVVVQATEGDRGILASVLHSQGRFAKDLWLEAPSAMVPQRINQDLIDQGRHFPTMDGKLVFKHAVRRFCEAIEEVLAKGGETIANVDLLVPHQANQRITEAVGKRMGLPTAKVFSNIARYGNTTAATIPIALGEAVETGRLQSGNLVITVAFGSGFTWGANLIRW